MTEQDFKGMMQTEIGALSAEGKGDSGLCTALKETLGWMDSTAYQYRKKNYTKKEEEPKETPGTVEEKSVEKGWWIRPKGATPKSYKWICSVCGKETNYIPFGKKGTEAKCDFAFCPRCGNPMEL